MRAASIALLLVLLAAPGRAAESPGSELRRIETTLNRIVQEQQSVYQQFQMVQTLLQQEEDKTPPLRTYTPPAAPRNYEDVQREEQARAALIERYREDLKRLYARHRELEEERSALGRRLSELVPQR
jgi:hypothetical protein